MHLCPTVQRVQQTIHNIWTGSATSAILETDDARSLPTSTPKFDGPFAEPKMNEIWQVLASQMQDSYESYMGNIQMGLCKIYLIAIIGSFLRNYNAQYIRLGCAKNTNKV